MPVIIKMEMKSPGGSRNGVNIFLRINIWQSPLAKPTIDQFWAGFKDEFQGNCCSIG
jgi:hypothetical protein